MNERGERWVAYVIAGGLVLIATGLLVAAWTSDATVGWKIVESGGVILGLGLVLGIGTTL